MLLLQSSLGQLDEQDENEEDKEIISVAIYIGTNSFCRINASQRL